MNTIAIIPARSGSKGLKDKNIKELLGKPLLAYTIESAISSKMFDEIMVSTDSPHYAEIAKQFGANVPFLRSPYTSSDTASTRECIIEVIEMYKQRQNQFFDKLMILQPTSPLRTASDIQNAFKLYHEKNAKSVFGVCEVDHSPLWCNTLNDDLSLKNFITNSNNRQRQTLSTFYRINGAIYLHDTNYYIANDYLYDDTAFAYLMDRSHSIDIDEQLDFDIAESLLRKYCNPNI